MEVVCPIQIEAQIASGGFANVYRAKSGEETVALKQPFKGDPTVEIDVLCRLRHPNMIYAKELIDLKLCGANGIGYVLPLATIDMGSAILNNIYPLQLFNKHFRQIIGAVSFLNSQNIFHLDLKLNNILLVGDLENCDAVLTDFGFSRYTRDVKIGFEITRETYSKMGLTPREYRKGYDKYPFNVATEIGMLGEAFYSVIYYSRQVGKPTNFNIDLIEQWIDKMAGDPDIRPSYSKILRSLNMIQVQGYINEPPRMPEIINPNVIDSINSIIGFFTRYLSNNLVERLFLAIDIGYRASGLLINNPDKDGLFPIAVIIMVLNMFSPEEATRLISDKLQFTNINELDKMRDNIILFLGGIIYRRYLYHGAADRNQLLMAYKYVVSNKDVYYIIDIPAFYSQWNPDLHDNKDTTILYFLK